jgi:PEP-CTERM motif
MTRSVCSAVVLSILLLLSASAYANSGILLTFQGVGDLQQVGNFYNGGGLTSTPNFGITFSSNFYGLLPTPAGHGNYAKTPTGMPAIFICGATCGSGAGSAVTGVMNVAPGFTNGLNFFYSLLATKPGQTETVTVWSGANGTGTILAVISLSSNACAGPVFYCTWSQAALSFSGTAHSVTFTGPADQLGLSDITVGSSTTAVPEPSSIYLLGTGLAGVSLGGIRRLFSGTTLRKRS